MAEIPANDVAEWMRIEGEYSWKRFSDAGKPVESEVAEVMRDGVRGDYWSGFTGSYYNRFQIFKDNYPLRADQALLKEAATFRTIGVCMRMGAGQDFLDAEQSTYDQITVQPTTHPIVAQLLGWPDFGKIHLDLALQDTDAQLKKNNLPEAISIIETTYLELTSAGITFAKHMLDGQLPTPGISMSDTPTIWERTSATPLQ